MKFSDLQNRSLLRESMYVDGQWCQAANGSSTDIYSPSDDSLLGSMPFAGFEETNEAIRTAQNAFVSWRDLLPAERAEHLRNFHKLIVENVETLAQIVTLEQGKPLADARAEVIYGANFIHLYSEEATRVYGEIIPQVNRQNRNLVSHEPIGVVGAITPWNFPSVLVARKMAPALAAGCTMVLKPAPQTPFSAIALAALADEAGIPAGVFNVITGDAELIGGALMAAPEVRMITFTGSTNTGRELLRQAADTVKRVTLELGGNAPFIVFDDANLELAVEHAIASKFKNAGQVCSCTNRFLVQEGIKSEFLRRLKSAVESLVVGNGFDSNVKLGPLISNAAVEKVEVQIKDAVSQGANIIIGGNRHKLGSNYFEPTIVDGVTQSMKLANEETFGPVASILTFKDEDEAIQIANATEYGLTAYFFTQDPDRIFRVSERLQSGIVGANTAAASNAFVPFGGMKQSGSGREGSHHGIDEYLETKVTCIGNVT